MARIPALTTKNMSLTGLATLVAVGAFVVSMPIALAANLGPVSGGNIGTSSVAAAGCDAAQDTVDLGTSPITSFVSPNRYEFNQVRINGVAAACRGSGEFYRINLVSNAAGSGVLTNGVLSGPLSANQNGTYSFTPGSRPQVGDLANSNSAIPGNSNARIVVLIAGTG